MKVKAYTPLEGESCFLARSCIPKTSCHGPTRFLTMGELPINAMTLEKIIHLQKMSSVGQFAAGLVHDIRTFAGHVQHFAALAEKAVAVEESPGHYLQNVASAVQKILSMSSALVNYGKCHRAGYHQVSLNKVVADTVSFLKPAFGGQVVLEIDEQAQVSVFGDERQLEQILVNLVNNAYQAFRGATGKVSISIYRPGRDEIREEGFVALSVEDNGGGMEEEVLSRISEPFFSTKQEGGTGLGLFMVKTLTHFHQGFIGVRSEAGQGSVFTVYLPSLPTSP